MTDQYKTIDTLTLFQNQANHYKHILKPKRTILFPQTQSKSQISRHSLLNNKYTKKLDRDIKLENRRMLKELIHLQNKKGLMQKAEQNYRAFTSQNKRLSLINPYKAKNVQAQRQNANKTLELKCKQIEPFVGTKKQWARCEQFNKKIGQRLSNKSPFSQQVKNTQIFMQMFKTTDNSNGCGWVSLLNKNNENVEKTKSKTKTKNLKSRQSKRAKSTLNKKIGIKQLQLNLDKEVNNEIYRQNAQINDF